MNIKALTLATILGFSSPLILDLAMSDQVTAQTFSYPQGTFVDRDWSVSLAFYNNAYVYYGENRHNGANITLSGATTSGNYQRQIYTWNNAGTRYRVSWRSQDPNYIRIEVIQPNGRVSLNRLLRRS